MSFRSGSLLFLLACHGKDDPVGPGTEPPEPPVRPTDPTTPPLDPCAIPVSLAPDVSGVLPLQSARFEATGGSGTFAYELVEDASGAILDERTGAYVAGALSNTVDRVRVVDGTCGGSAEATIEVWGGLVLEPASGVVPPFSSFTITADGGSGAYTCALERAETGGSLAGCTWTGGGVEGTDEVRVTDTVTGEEASGSYTVEAGVELSLWGSRLYLPEGQPFTPTWLGGTGVVDLTIAGAGLASVDGVLTGTVEGTYVVDAADRFVPAMTTSFEVDVVAWRTVPPVRDGERQYWGQVVGADVDGDGFADAVVGSAEASVGAHWSGGVFVYRGSAAGLEAAPVATYAVPQQYAYTGRSVAVGDLDGDGAPELAIGAEGWDDGNTVDEGRIEVFRGVPGGFFEDEPSWTYVGVLSSERLGFALAICDVDGDGTSDLVGTAYGAEDESQAIVSTGQGGVFVWTGSVFGPSTLPVYEAFGRTPVGGVFAGDIDLHLSERLVALDYDGDAQCDLAVSSSVQNLDGVGADGVVALYTGAALMGPTPVDPVRIYSTDEADDNVQFGRALGAADLDGDGLDDLLVGAWTADGPGSTRGAAWAFLTADDDGRPATTVVQAPEASLILRGDGDSDYLGQAVTGADLDGDGLDEWIIGTGADESYGGTSGTGTVLTLDGAFLASRAFGTEVTTLDASAIWPGVDVNDWFGTEVGAVGDTDGDGAIDLVTLASRDDGDGIEAGAPFVIEAGVARRLDFPGAASGQHLGDRGAVGWTDLDDDGDLDLIAGAWGTGRAPDGYNSGVAYAWTDSGGWTTTADSDWQGQVNHSAADRFGQAVASAGDFDGDGYEDLALVSYTDSKPTTFGVEFANPYDCPGSVSGTGVLYVYSGGSGGVSDTPAFAFYGYTASDHIELVDGGFDHDGDGFDDLIVGSTGYALEGGGSIVTGRAADPSGITVICTADHVLGVSSGSRLGTAVAGAGDLDGDGCDEAVIGADADDLGTSNQGSVRVLWGYGAACASTTPMVTTLGPGVTNTRAGNAVDAGQDVDGDGVPDVVVGGYDHEEIAGQDVGAVWMLSGSWLASLPRQSRFGALPGDLGTTVTLFPAARWAGTVLDGELGSALALVPDPASPGTALVAAGWRFGAVGGGARSGGVVVLGWSGATFAAEPVGLIGGETLASGAEVGDALAGDPRASVLAVGAPLSDAADLDAGAVLPVQLR